MFDKHSRKGRHEAILLQKVSLQLEGDSDTQFSLNKEQQQPTRETEAASMSLMKGRKGLTCSLASLILLALTDGFIRKI